MFGILFIAFLASLHTVSSQYYPPPSSYAYPGVQAWSPYYQRYGPPAPAYTASAYHGSGYLAPGYPASGFNSPGYPVPGYPVPGYPVPGYPTPGHQAATGLRSPAWPGGVATTVKPPALRSPFKLPIIEFHEGDVIDYEYIYDSLPEDYDKKIIILKMDKAKATVKSAQGATGSGLTPEFPKYVLSTERAPEPLPAEVPATEASPETEEAPEKATEEATEHAAEGVTEQGAEEATEEATEHAAEEVTEEATEEATVETTEEATEHAAEDSSSRGPPVFRPPSWERPGAPAEEPEQPATAEDADYGEYSYPTDAAAGDESTTEANYYD